MIERGDSVYGTFWYSDFDKMFLGGDIDHFFYIDLIDMDNILESVSDHFIPLESCSF